jgi:hypothetical protein
LDLQVDGFLRTLWFPPPIKLTAMIADHDLVKKRFGPMIADHDLVKKR